MARSPGGGSSGGAGQRRVRRYSRIVRAMKVALPLAAVALVAAIFLSVRDRGDLTDLFTPEELATLGAGLKLDNPRFAGVTSKGEAFAVQADWALPDSAMPTVVELAHPRGEIELTDGRKLTASAQGGRLLRQEKKLVLEGDVVLDSSDGYHMETALVEFDLEGKAAHAPGPVSGTGPRGRITAGSLRAEAGDEPGEPGKIWFENRVRLVFIPGEDGK